MRTAKLLKLLTSLLLLAGLATLGVGLVRREGVTGLPLAGAGLIFLGGASSVMASVVFRRGCRELVATSRAMAADGNVHLLDPPDTELQPLVAAVNECLAVANSLATDARSRQRELEIELKVATSERQHAEAVIDSIGDAVIVTDPFDEVVLANDAAARALHFDLAAAERSPVADVLNDPTLVGLIREQRQSRAGGGPRVVDHELRDAGVVKAYQVSLTRVAPAEDSPEGEGCGVVAVLRDMTWEREVARAKNDFVSHVSHELRTPLASIKAYVEMLIDGEADDDRTRREFHEVIQNEANRLGRLIDDILNISRIESGLAKINKQPVSPMLVMKQAIEVILPQARAKNIAVEETLGASLYLVQADKDMLYQAVLNLLSNAVKYTPEGGKVSVRLDVDEAARTLTCRVVDNGAGIPEKDLPHVFEKFYRVEANNKLAKGTGLGLPLVKQIVEQVHRGTMFVESAVGKGSTFGFTLSLAD